MMLRKVTQQGFPVVTKDKQAAFEQAMEGKSDETPCICGYYGRACRQMDKPEGANRVNCMYCPLAEFCEG